MDIGNRHVKSDSSPTSRSRKRWRAQSISVRCGNKWHVALLNGRISDSRLTTRLRSRKFFEISCCSQQLFNNPSAIRQWRRRGVSYAKEVLWSDEAKNRILISHGINSHHKWNGIREMEEKRCRVIQLERWQRRLMSSTQFWIIESGGGE